MGTVGTDDRITVTRVVAAPPSRVFLLLADPTRHAEIDGSGMIRAAVSREPVIGPGQVFVMDMHNERLGDYRIANSVVAYEPDAVIGWAPGRVGQPARGHTYTYRLAPADGGGTEIALTYDWARVTDADLRARMPAIPPEALADSLERIAAVVET